MVHDCPVCGRPMEGGRCSGHAVVVHSSRRCDFCAQNGDQVDARYDAKTVFGPWADMCQAHFEANGIELGTGLGQRLVYGEGA